MPSQTRNRRHNHFAKIFAFAAVLFFVAFLLIKFFHFSPLLLGGPKSVVQFLTNTGLKSDNNRINILLLGVGGEGHEGPYLTDTMIIASVDKDGHDVALISVPRDIWVPDKKEKINTVYANSKNGLKPIEQTFSKLFGIPIHYAVRIDFSGFEKAVDLVDGLDIAVDNSFTDNKYPIAGKEDDTCGYEIENRRQNGILNVYFKQATSSATTAEKSATSSATLLKEENDPFICRYETLSFAKGQTHMDGKTALKFVRSRHGDNDEGSDFSRSVRQEKVLLAFRQKVLSVGILNPKKILDLTATFGSSQDTDITSYEIPLFIKLFQKVDQNAVRKITLDSGKPDSKLEAGDPSQYGGAFVLLPKGGSWQDLADFIQGEIFKTVQGSSSPPPTNK